jgi:hypothetical protein
MKMICEFSDLKVQEILNFESFFKQKDFLYTLMIFQVNFFFRVRENSGLTL